MSTETTNAPIAVAADGGAPHSQASDSNRRKAYLRFSGGRLLARDDGNSSADLTRLEREILASVQERLDKKAVVDALMEEAEESTKPVEHMPQWRIALASAVALSALCFVLTSGNILLASASFVLVFVSANGDPLDESNATGAAARIIGRSTIRSYQASQPKLKALARAVVTEEEEVIQLQKRVKQLEKENADLKRWIRRQQQTEEQLSKFTLEDLRYLARQERIPVAGSKAQLFMRLLDAGAIKEAFD